MAAKKLVDITMTSLFLLLLLVPATGYVSGAVETPAAGIMPMDGVSPVPTEAPGSNGIPKELRRREIQSFIDPAPPNWCGMINDDYQSIWSCSPNTSCMLISNFYVACGCSTLNTDTCSALPTICFDYERYQSNTRIDSLTVACIDSSTPYCFTVTSSGLSQQFTCGTTSFPRTYSFVPVAAYYSSLSATTVPTTSPAKTTIPDSPIATSTSDSNSSPTGKKKSKLSSSAKAGIGSGAGLGTLAVIAAIANYLRQKQKRAHVSPTTGGAGPVMAQTNNRPQGYQGAAQPVQQQYQPQPQGYQGAAQPVQQHQPQSENANLPDLADIILDHENDALSPGAMA